MVGVNIRIAREITSVALIANENKNPAATEALLTYYHETERIIDGLIALISEETPTDYTPDFNAVKASLTSFAGKPSRPKSSSS